MPKYRVGDMLIRHGVGDKVRELLPGTIVELSEPEAAAIGKSIEPVEAKKTGAAAAAEKQTADPKAK